ncbi:hypothetical protein IAE35_12755 [Pseudomonas sp. S75]|uniref:hypothetical protein n=1 Tax=unclassified Pseudomonas TaxID=196821 RepID=UPI0019040716|nr:MULTISPECIES: hypothetical protein [unclassified Pseudomonas]MBJ9974480.1 hypothetical protein [Pseudomonas sp. S30]MBK0154211.1 hypothetical protein [Pseudomonas sp. S75]
MLFTLLAPLAAHADIASQAPTLCAMGDQPIFSCPLNGTAKTVSLCASGDVAHGAGHFYYGYGRVGPPPELTYPASDEQATFTRTHLMLGGGSGGYAYAFTRGGLKYTLYSMSGANNFHEGGLTVAQEGQTKPLKHLTCQAGKFTDTEDDALIDATLKWKSDPAIEKNGLQVP